MIEKSRKHYHKSFTQKDIRTWGDDITVNMDGGVVDQVEWMMKKSL